MGRLPELRTLTDSELADVMASGQGAYMLLDSLVAMLSGELANLTDDINVIAIEIAKRLASGSN